MLSSVGRKRKEKNALEKEIHDDSKEIKLLLTEGKALYEKAKTSADYLSILLILNKGISKLTSTHITNANMLLYYRGLCYFNLKEYEKAEKDFNEGISVVVDEKIKPLFYNSLGKCKFAMSEQDPLFVRIILFLAGRCVESL